MSTTTASLPTPGELADAAVDAILAGVDALATNSMRGLVVDSPPGAGKSTLVVRAAGHLVAQGREVVIVAQTNEQVDDLTVRLVERHPGLTVGRLLKSTGALSSRLDALDRVIGARRMSEFQTRPSVIIATAAKWAWITDDQGHWPLAIIDEAYQMRSDALLACAGLFDKALFVGDPGQLDPFSTVATERWHGLSWNPLNNAVDVTLAHNPTMALHALPVSWRLPPRRPN